MPGFSLRPAGLGLTLLAMLSAPASAAPDPAAVADQIVAVLAAQGEAVATYESVAANGTSIVISGIRLAQKDGDDRVVILPQVTLHDVTERESGGFAAASATFDDGSLSDNGRRMTWSTAIASEIIVPSTAEASAETKIRPFAAIEMTGIEAYRTGRESPATTVGRVGFSLGPIVEGQTSMLAIDATGITATVDELAPGRRAALMKSLGYETLVIDVAMAGAVDLYADTLVLDPLIVSIADLGDIRATGRLGGVSVGGFVAGSRRDEATEAAQVESLTVHFDNGGIVERALDRQAAAMGVERTAFVENFLGAVPFMLNFIGNRPFQAKLAAAANTFLREPRSVTFAANPETPVSLEAILAAAATNRSALPDLLAVEVTANE